MAIVAIHSAVMATCSVDELLWSRLIFGLGAVVTLATVVMIVRGHLYWQHRDSRHAG